MQVDVGDVLVVRLGGIFGWLIRFAARLRGRPHGNNHIAVVHHLDADGTPWVVEGEPEGVRMASGAAYLTSKSSVANVGQPKTPEQRQQIAALAESFLHCPYDWAAISADATNAFDIHDPFVPEWTADTVPARVVCSSLATYIYTKLGLDAPSEGRLTTPGDWEAFIRAHHFDAGRISTGG